MKNQYFGDIKDLFKYDLAGVVLCEIPALERITFVTMLTEDDGRSDGNKLDYQGRAGYENRQLVDYLREKVIRGQRNVSEIRPYFEARGTNMCMHGAQDYFKHKTRSQYFDSIDKQLLESSLILIDPDNGVQTKRSNERHILLSEVSQIFSRMSDDSIIMLFQHFRREKHAVTIDRVSSDLKGVCGVRPLWICDNEIIFFFLSKDCSSRSLLEQVIHEYQRRYQQLRVSWSDGGG